MPRLAAVAALCLLVAACAGGDEDVYVDQPVEALYNKAMDSLNKSDYQAAAKNFREVERQHPYSVWATRAQLMAAYANYEMDEYDDAILAAEEFIELHPGHADVAYAYYLKAISYYEQIADIGRDQTKTRKALDGLGDIVRRFPGSRYARDARLKIDLARDHLAGKDMEVGRFYLKRGYYVAAINRFRSVITDFQTTSHVPEALHRLTEAYLALGVESEAQTAAAVLGYNFPGSEWYIDSYALLKGVDLRPDEDKGSWISRAWNAVF